MVSLQAKPMGVLCITAIEFGILINLVRQLKLCLYETCSRVWEGKILSDMFPVDMV